MYPGVHARSYEGAKKPALKVEAKTTGTSSKFIRGKYQVYKWLIYSQTSRF